MISIEFDTKGMERILSPLAGLPKEITKALKLAARRTGQSLRSDIRKGVRAESYLRGGDIGKAFGVLEVKEAGTAVTASFRVAGGWLPADHFKLIPNRVTARKRVRSVKWPSAGFKIGPSEPVRRPEGGSGLSKAFIILLNGKKMMFQRYGKKTRCARKGARLFRTVFFRFRSCAETCHGAGALHVREASCS